MSGRSISELHEEAMALAEAAFVESRRGRAEEAERLNRRALALETDAAMLLFPVFDAEPSRSVLFRSAATLAGDLKEWDRAERLAACGLAGPDAPEELRNQLRAVVENASFHRHLDRDGLGLEPGEVRMFLLGPGVGHGMVHATEVSKRIDLADRMLVRMRERQRGLQFRETGRPTKEIREDVDLVMSVPEAGSFSVKFRVGRKQKNLFDDPALLVRKLVDCLGAVQRRDDAQLADMIPEAPYRTNFRALVRNLAPDGKGLSKVGFAARLPSGTHTVALDAGTRRGPQSRSGSSEAEMETLVGFLRVANAAARTPRIEVLDADGEAHRVSVPAGMMNDIVRPYFGERVCVRVTRKLRRAPWTLISIDPDY